MSSRARLRRREPGVEYSVYIFHRHQPQNDNHINQYVPWEKRHTTTNIRKAYRKAIDLFNSHEYERVEIKKKFFDPRKECNIDKTLKIFTESGKRPVGLPIALMTSLAIVCMAMVTIILIQKP